MRRLYLEAVLRQEVHFFDAAPSSQSTTFGIITTISDDADTIQDFLSEKVRPPILCTLVAIWQWHTPAESPSLES